MPPSYNQHWRKSTLNRLVTSTITSCKWCNLNLSSTCTHRLWPVSGHRPGRTQGSGRSSCRSRWPPSTAVLLRAASSSCGRFPPASSSQCSHATFPAVAKQVDDLWTSKGFSVSDWSKSAVRDHQYLARQCFAQQLLPSNAQSIGNLKRRVKVKLVVFWTVTKQHCHHS